jgi:hypothetical protein
MITPTVSKTKIQRTGYFDHIRAAAAVMDPTIPYTTKVTWLLMIELTNPKRLPRFRSGEREGG